MAVGARGTRLVVGGKSAHVVVYAICLPDLGEGLVDDCDSVPLLKEIGRFAPAGTVLSLTVDAKASIVCTGGEAKLVQIWSLYGIDEVADWKAEKPVAAFRCPSIVHSVCLTAVGAHLAVGLSDCTEVYHLEHGRRSTLGAGDEIKPEKSKSFYACNGLALVLSK